MVTQSSEKRKGKQMAKIFLSFNQLMFLCFYLEHDYINDLNKL